MSNSLKENVNSMRKIRKPLMEKKRRARINDSLEALKDILLKNTVAVTQGSRPTKLEKADILEMTVRYLNALHTKLMASRTPSADCSVSSTTTRTKMASVKVVKPMLFGAGNPYSMANGNGQFGKLFGPQKRIREFGKADERRTMNTVNGGGHRKKLKCSENSAFKTIDKNVATGKDDPWRPW